jgi:hypothetical protein
MGIRESRQRYVACRRREGNRSGAVWFEFMRAEATVLFLEARIGHVESIEAAMRAFAKTSSRAKCVIL